MKKRILIFIGILFGAVLLLLAGLIAFLTVTEYRPADVQDADHFVTADGTLPAGQSLTVCTWNIGYGGLGKESDFFMDGGSMVNPPSQDTVQKNLEGIRALVAGTPADIWLFQEVDVDSARSGYQNQFPILLNSVQGLGALAYNYNCPFVPIPMPPIGKVESGIATVTGALKTVGTPQRISLPCPFSWPVRAANLKRCLLVTRVQVENTERELVLVNLHLEAYESGEGRIAQTKQLMNLMQAEYEKGNYVIAGGDFNQSFPVSLDVYPILDSEKWTPGVLEESILPEGWQFAFDDTVPTCRLLDQPLSDACQRYVIDGFILSPNVKADKVETIDGMFEYSDHNPVRLEVTLLS